MEEVTIPAWFIWVVGLFITITVPWAIWITRQQFKNDKDIALNTANDVATDKELLKIYELIDESSKDNKIRFDKIDHKFDKMDEKLTQFLMQEVLFMKRVIPE